MNPYLRLALSIGTTEALSLYQRLTAWHDAMVAHERRLITARATDECGEDCAHAEARALWREAAAAFGSHSGELMFLRSRALGVGGAQSKIA